MWPFRKRLDVMALRVVIDEQSKAIEDLGRQIEAELTHLTWRLDMMIRFYEETSGFIAPGEWGASPLMGGGPPPADCWAVPPPPEPPPAPVPTMPVDAFSLPNTNESGAPQGIPP